MKNNENEWFSWISYGVLAWPVRPDESICDLGGPEPLPSRKCLRQRCQAWLVRSDESICDLGVRAPPTSQMSSSGLQGLAGWLAS